MALALSGSAAARALAQLLAPTTRGYAAAAASGAMRRGAADRKAAGEAEKASTDASWVPDPVTGHYRPANRTAAVDPADLRAAHLGRTYARA
jgi:hypothetical protein